MNAGNVGRKNSTDTTIAAAPNTSAVAQRCAKPICGRGGKASATRSVFRAGAPSQISPAGICRPAASADCPRNCAFSPITVSFSITAYDSTTASRPMLTGPRISSPASTRAFSIFTNVPMLAPSSTVSKSGAPKLMVSIITSLPTRAPIARKNSGIHGVEASR